MDWTNGTRDELKLRFAQEVLSSMPSVVTVARVHPFELLWSNATRILGYSRERVLELGPAFLRGAVHAEDYQRVVVNAYERLRTCEDEECVFTEVFRARHKDRSWRWLLSTIRPFRQSSTGVVSEALAVVTDITRQPQINLVLDSLREENRNLKTELVLQKLTPREREVIALIASGYTTPEIAGVLHLSPHTVDKHRRALAAKLKARNVAELVRIAVEMGLHKSDLVRGSS